jgi:ornithine carrier protein
MACNNVITQTSRLPGVVELTRSILNTDGLRGLWLGHIGTMLRESGGYAAWFISKEWVARRLLERRLGEKAKNLQSNANLLTWESGLSGGIAGAVGALVCYPADTVKSAIQTEDELLKSSGIRGREARPRRSFSSTFSRMWKTHGLRGLYAGCGMTVARAVPSSGVIFAVYDGLFAWLS